MTLSVAFTGTHTTLSLSSLTVGSSFTYWRLRLSYVRAGFCFYDSSFLHGWFDLLTRAVHIMFCRTKLRRANVNFLSAPIMDGTTGTVIVLTTPDAQRTMLAYQVGALYVQSIPIIIHERSLTFFFY